MMSLIYGLAGHVDHGKTSLIQALIGFNGDQTPEEKRRGLTIDLSFSFCEDNHKRIFFIDVPGHEKFVKNYLAGVFGFHKLLLIVSAIEGIREQTLEHLEIAKLVGLRHIVVVLTKIDCVDFEHLDFLQLSIEELLSSYNFHNDGIYRCSIYQQETINHLKHALFNQPFPTPHVHPFFRCYIDRSFAKDGFGTIITGTISQGSITLNDKIFIPNLGKNCVIKGIESAQNHTSSASLGERVALNLSSLKSSELQRGYQLISPNFLRGFQEIDVYIELLNNKELKHLASLKLYIGTARYDVKVKILSFDEQGYYATLESSEKLYTLFKERFILRNETGTIGGGEILNPIAEPMKKKQKTHFLFLLKNNHLHEAFTFLVQTHKKGFGLLSAYQRFNFTPDDALNIARDLNHIFCDESDKVLYHHSTLDFLKNDIYHIFTKNPRALLSKHALSLRYTWATPMLCETLLCTLASENFLTLHNGLYKRYDSPIHDITLFLEERLYELLEQGDIAPLAPYTLYDSNDIDRQAGDNALKRLCSRGKVVRLSHNLFITNEALHRILTLFRHIIQTQGYIDIDQAKHHLPLSRKYLIAYLEYLDKFSDIHKDGQRRFYK